MAELIVEPIESYALSQKDRPKALFAKVGIVGCGVNGRSIAIMISARGIDVVFIEVSEEKIAEAYDGMNEELDNMINHWGMTASEKKVIISRIKGYTDYSYLKGSDLVIEAILSKTRENSVGLRKEVFKQIENNVDTHTIIATNSTTIVITELASELKHKERCISMHISTTMPDADIIEVVRGLYTSQEVCDNIRKFAKLIDRVVIPVQESPGLISIRIFVALVNEACEVLMERIGSIDNIDLTMRNGFGLPLGPFEMSDKIGLDKVLRWMENIYNEFGDSKYKASPIIKRLVRGNHLGRKTGQGFYMYDKDGKKCGVPDYIS